MESKEILEFLGLDPEKIKTVDDLKPAFETEFVRTKTLSVDSEVLKPIIGKVLGPVENALQSTLKALDAGIDFEAADWKGAKTKDKIKLAFEKFSEKTNTVIEDLKAKANQGNDVKVTELQKELEKRDLKYKDLEGRHNTVVTEFDTHKKTAEEKLKEKTMGILFKDKMAKLTPQIEASELQMTGFNAILKSKYVLELNDKEDDIIVKDAKTGLTVPSKTVTGASKTFEEIFTDEAIEQKIFKANPQGGKGKTIITKSAAEEAAENAKKRPGRTVGKSLRVAAQA